MLWAVANTLTVFGVRNVGLSIAFPLWNINSLVGLFWGWLLFKELRGSGWGRVVGGAVAIVGGAAVLAYATSQKSQHHAGRRGARDRGGAHCRTAAGHHVHSVPEGLYQRHEPAVVRHGIHVRRTGHGVDAWRWSSTEGCTV
jgi:hypothetical protein